MKLDGHKIICIVMSEEKIDFIKKLFNEKNLFVCLDRNLNNFLLSHLFNVFVNGILPSKLAIG